MNSVLTLTYWQISTKISWRKIKK